MVETMSEQLRTADLSNAAVLPYDRQLAQAYREMGEKPSFDMVAAYDPLDLLPDVLNEVFDIANMTKIIRSFKPGEGEGTHTDDFDRVLTLTQFGAADFTHGDEARLLKANHCVLFNPRVNHEVSAPFGGKYRRIAAFAFNLA